MKRVQIAIATTAGLVLALIALAALIRPLVPFLMVLFFLACLSRIAMR